jgi:hypothetical protein
MGMWRLTGRVPTSQNRKLFAAKIAARLRTAVDPILGASSLQNYLKARTAQGRRISCPKNSTRRPKNASAASGRAESCKESPGRFHRGDCRMLVSKGCAPLDATHYPKHKSIINGCPKNIRGVLDLFSTTLADLLTPLLAANPFLTMRASLRR